MSVTTTLTVKDVAAVLGIQVEVVRRLIRRGELRASNIGTAAKPMYRIRQAALEKFLDEREVLGVEG
ncbi:helix-turn-helix domain-containing protein [Halodesulfovibrio sp.]|jgi:excisionase family DNA binding protein|uniref:helix-turn-helix domain-containing protein n=1 Tax=Halodesulfovibrio sp. TaxID=1912772 RepID=UPI0025CC8684|nr:helix-turn-helix domain-containing protein [Halodesulfovibrio sp.]MCT4626986.1 helix-turn-helix domain-containing protein [Halodesulfovibrio sp.]MCT4627908.1 helix-turn-helix domain-containing protein [Halodesulfovibrio sp.]